MTWRHRVMWNPPDRDRHFVWWYYAVPAAVYKGRSGGRVSIDICLGFVWTGFVSIHLGGAS